MRTNFDFSPYRRSTVGFDRLFDLMENYDDPADNYPPFDVEKRGENSYRITLAVAGFRPDEVEIVAQQNQVTVTGRKVEDKETGSYIHRGIATRSFERRFQLADFVQVRSASVENGLLVIALEREIPEAMKPRKIQIGSAPASQQLEAKQEEESQAA